MERKHENEETPTAMPDRGGAAGPILPEQLIESGDRPRPLQRRGQRISELVEGTRLELRGEDREITRFGPLSSLSDRDQPGALLSYLSSERWAHELAGSTGRVFI